MQSFENDLLFVICLILVQGVMKKTVPTFWKSTYVLSNMNLS